MTLATITKKPTALRPPLQVIRSAAGFYIGTIDEYGPFSRESAEYFQTEESAKNALSTGEWTQREEP